MTETRQIDASAELQRALDLLVKNWQLALPTALASLAFAVFTVLVVLSALTGLTGASVLSGGEAAASKAMGAIMGLLGSATFLIGMPLLVLLLIVANVMTIAAAENAWQGRPPAWDQAFRVAINRLPAIIVSAVLIALIALIPSVLVLAFGLGLLLLLVLGFFMMYVTPSIVLGNRNGAAAIGESARIVRANAGASALAFAAIVIVAIIGQVVTSVVGHVPFLNFVAAFLIGGFTAAYSALVSARFYDVLGGRATS
jgi:hypothetical protein